MADDTGEPEVEPQGNETPGGGLGARNYEASLVDEDVREPQSHEDWNEVESVATRAQDEDLSHVRADASETQEVEA